jgi:hypothetical protein
LSKVYLLWSCHRLQYSKNTAMPVREHFSQTRLSAMAIAIATTIIERSPVRFRNSLACNTANFNCQVSRLRCSCCWTMAVCPIRCTALEKLSERLGRIATLISPLSMFVSNFMAVQGDYPGHWNFADSFARHPQRIPPDGRVERSVDSRGPKL